jgi:hypothetical protein
VVATAARETGSALFATVRSTSARLWARRLACRTGAPVEATMRALTG